jgi:hypothetical protein
VRVLATRPILAGEEITISYTGSEFAYDNLARRQKMLPLLLGFTCTCLTCDAEARLGGGDKSSVAPSPLLPPKSEEEKETTDEPPSQPRAPMSVAEAAGFVEADALAKKKKEAAAHVSRRAKAKAAYEAGKLAEAEDKAKAAAAAAAPKPIHRGDMTRYMLECALEDSLGYGGHVDDLKLFHLEATQQLEASGAMPCSKMRKKAAKLMASLDQHLARNDASTDIVLGQAWSLLHLLLTPNTTVEYEHTEELDAVEWSGMRVWPWLVHKYLDLFLRSFLEHGFRKPVAIKKDKTRRKLVWMIPPAQLESFFTQLIQHHQQQTSALLPYHLRVLVAVLFTLFKQQAEPENFSFQGAHSPLIERTQRDIDAEATAAAIAAAAAAENPYSLATHKEPRLLAFLDVEEKKPVAAAAATAMTDCDDAFGGERYHEPRLLSYLGVREYRPFVSAATREKRRRIREQRDYRWAATAVFLRTCLSALSIVPCQGNAALLVEVEAALCFSEWNESLLFAVCSFDTPQLEEPEQAPVDA